MKLRIQYHSFVDVITNSSSEIYTIPHSKSIKMVKEMITCFLKASGSDKKCDDIFSVEFELEESILQDIKDECKPEEDVNEKIKERIDACIKNGDGKEDGDGESHGAIIVIRSKTNNKFSMNLMKKFNEIFNSVELMN